MNSKRDGAKGAIWLQDLHNNGKTLGLDDNLFQAYFTVYTVEGKEN